MKVFLDSNVLASALIARGLCTELFEAVLQSHELAISQAVLDELGRVLPGKLGIPERITREFIRLLKSNAEVVSGLPVPVELPDPDDVPVVGSALAGNVDFFVTGDKTLLDLGAVNDLPLVSPRGFWEILKEG